MALKAGDQIQLENVNEVLVSDPEQEVFEFVWRLKKFAAVFEGESIMSPVFTSPIMKTEWRVEIRWPLDSSSKRYVYMGLRFIKSQAPLPLPTGYTKYYLDSEKEILQGPFNSSFNFTRNDELHETRLYELSTLMNVANRCLAADGSLNLLFRVTTTKYNPNDVKRQEPESVVLPIMNRETFKSLLKNGEFSDLTVKTKASSFPASKMILAVQSPVFKAMFLSEMRESRENVVKIEDFPDETVKMFLEFLYTGQCESLEENAVELLKIGDKYEVVNLKRACEKSLINALNKENAADLLILASFYNSTLLKSKVVTFVRRCRKEVAETKSFKELKKLHPGILLDLYAEFD